MSQSTPTKHDGRAVLFAVAELLVMMTYNLSNVGLTGLVFFKFCVHWSEFIIRSVHAWLQVSLCVGSGYDLTKTQTDGQLSTGCAISSASRVKSRTEDKILLIYIQF